MSMHQVSGSTPTDPTKMTAYFGLAPGQRVTHATDSDTNAERDYIINVLSKRDVIENVTLYKAGDQLLTKHVNHYITDGEVAVAGLVERA